MSVEKKEEKKERSKKCPWKKRKKKKSVVRNVRGVHPCMCEWRTLCQVRMVGHVGARCICSAGTTLVDRLSFIVIIINESLRCTSMYMVCMYTMETK